MNKMHISTNVNTEKDMMTQIYCLSSQFAVNVVFNRTEGVDFSLPKSKDRT